MAQSCAIKRQSSISHGSGAAAIVSQAVEELVKVHEVINFRMKLIDVTLKLGNHSHTYRHVAARRSAQMGLHHRVTTDTLTAVAKLSSEMVTNMTSVIDNRTDQASTIATAMQNLSTIAPPFSQNQRSDPEELGRNHRRRQDRQQQRVSGRLEIRILRYVETCWCWILRRATASEPPTFLQIPGQKGFEAWNLIGRSYDLRSTADINSAYAALISNGTVRRLPEDAHQRGQLVREQVWQDHR